MLASIILITYCPTEERKKLCEQCFSTVHLTGLHRRDYELIVVNNGGVHQDLVSQLDKDIELIFPENIGLADARNEGIKIAQGKYIAFLDDDLLFKYGWLKEGIDLCEKYKDKKFVISVRDIQSWRSYLQGEIDGYKILSKVGSIWITTKELVDRYGFFKEGLRVDRNYYKRFKKEGYFFLLSKEPYIFHLGEKSSIIYRNKKIYNNWYETHYSKLRH